MMPLKDMVLHVLEKPDELVPSDVCPTLWKLLTSLQMGPYKQRRHRKLGASKDPADSRKLEKLQRKQRLQVVGVLSQIAMMRDQRANPPWIVMR